MAYISPLNRDRVQRHLGAGGGVACIAGPRRTNLTQEVISLSPQWGHAIGATLEVPINLRELRSTEAVSQAMGSRLGLSEATDSPGDFISNVASCRPGSRLVVFSNFHSGDPEVQSFILEALITRDIAYSARDMPAFILEGALDFEQYLTEVFPDGPPISPLLIFSEPVTFWRAIIEIEDLVSQLSSAHFPASLLVWLSDMTAGDKGFCNEFLLRLSAPSIDAATLSRAYQAIISNGATARELRECAETHSDSTLSSLSQGAVIDGLPPPDTGFGLRRLYLEGITEYDNLLRGYRIRGPMVADVLSDNCSALMQTPPHRLAVSARSAFIFDQAARLELQMRFALSGYESRASEIQSPTPWAGMADIILQELATGIGSMDELSEDTKRRVMATVGKVARRILMNTRPAVENNQIVANSSRPVLDGFTFSNLADMARRVGLISEACRTRVSDVNERRNEAAHLRLGTYDEIYALDTLVQSVIAEMISRLRDMRAPNGEQA